jgi:anti-anti-sigma factor
MTEGLLEIEVRGEGAEVTLVLRGDLDMTSASTLRACLDSIDDGFRRVVLDLTDLRFMDSTGVGLIADTRRRFEPEMRELSLHNPSGHVAHVLELTGVGRVVRVTGTADPLGAAAV